MSAAQGTIRPLALRAFSTDQAAASRALGHGLLLAFDADGEPGSLSFEALPAHLAQQPPGNALQSDLGALWLTDGSAALSLFGGMPAIIEGEPQDWYWQLFNQSISPALRDVFGELRPLPVGLLPVDDHFCCRLTVARNGERLVAQLAASSATLLQLFRHPALLPLQAPVPLRLPQALSLEFPVLLGAVRLAMNTLRSLRPGDVVLVPDAAFDCTGYGHLVLGPWQCRGELASDGDDVHFSVHDLEERPMSDYDHANDPSGAESAWDAPPQEHYQAPEDDEYLRDDEPGHSIGIDDHGDTVIDSSIQGAFAELPLQLSLRSGALRLTLKQLQNLAPGSVLEIPGVKPGAATLYYGERPVAQGELVDIDGRLGLQILRMELA